jgi:hypothetical protein
MYDYLIKQKLSPSRQIFGLISNSLLLLSLFIPWGERIRYFTGESIEKISAIEFTGTREVFVHWILFLVALGYVSCFRKSNLLVIIGILTLVILWIPPFFLLDNHRFFSGTLLVNISSIMILLNQFLPDDKISKINERLLFWKKR